MTTQGVIDNFKAAAIAKGDFAAPTKDAEYHRAMSDAVRLLESSEEGRSAMHALLGDPKKEVRIWIAAHYLAQGDPLAREVLQTLAEDSGLTAFSASITLKEHDLGRLRSPFQK